MVEAMVYILRTGIPWRDLPQQFGKWSGAYCRWRRWTAAGLWDRLLAALARGARGTTRFIDSTHVKLHQDGANPAGGQGEQAIGRTKGGLNSKITAVVESHGRAVALSLHPGPCSDIRTADEHACLLRGRTLVADKGFDADALPASLTSADARASHGGGTAAAHVPSPARFIAAAIGSKTSSAASSGIVASALATTNSLPPSSPSFNSLPSSIGSRSDFANTP